MVPAGSSTFELEPGDLFALIYSELVCGLNTLLNIIIDLIFVKIQLYGILGLSVPLKNCQMGGYSACSVERAVA